MKKKFHKNIVQDYGFLSCRNELSSLAIVLTYNSTENCGIRIKNMKFYSASPHEKFLSPLMLLMPNTTVYGATIFKITLQRNGTTLYLSR